ncbi:MAG TPA: hypothetical protein VJZ26_03355 [Blastocatellia bacterium]|nr:hypothetical protein [Blastocatellia bacterium]
MNNQQLTHSILQEIDTLLKNGVLPVSVDHLRHLGQEGNILQYLIEMKNEGLISGDLITIGVSGTPHRITNIRLTYIGIRALAQPPDSKVLDAKQ